MTNEIDKDKKRVTLTLKIENAIKLDKLAKNMGVSKSALVTLWINSNK